MNRVYINISTSRYKKDSMPRSLAWTSLVVSVAVLVTISVVFVLQGIKLGEYDADIELIERKVLDESVKDMSPAELGRITKEVAVVNDLIKRESYSWVRLLSAVEANVPKNIYITQINPDLIRGNISLSGLGRSYSEVNNFIDMLNSSDSFEQAVPITQSILGKGSYGKDTVSFSIKVRYLKEPKVGGKGSE